MSLFIEAGNLGQYSFHSGIGGVDFDNELFSGVQLDEDWSISEKAFKFSKGGFSLRSPTECSLGRG